MFGFINNTVLLKANIFQGTKFVQFRNVTTEVQNLWRIYWMATGKNIGGRALANCCYRHFPLSFNEPEFTLPNAESIYPALHFCLLDINVQQFLPLRYLDAAWYRIPSSYFIFISTWSARTRFFPRWRRPLEVQPSIIPDR